MILKDTYPGTQPQVGAEVIAQVSLGHIEYRVTPLSAKSRELIIYVHTGDFTAHTNTDVLVTEGSGELVIKSTEGLIAGRRIMEAGAEAHIPVGTSYCYWATTGVFKVFEHSAPEISESATTNTDRDLL